MQLMLPPREGIPLDLLRSQFYFRFFVMYGLTLYGVGLYIIQKSQTVTHFSHFSS